MMTLHIDLVHSREPGNLTRLIAAITEMDGYYQIGTGLGYNELLPHSMPVAIDDGVSVQVLSLETYIQLKTELGRDKDLAVLPTLEEKRRTQA